MEDAELEKYIKDYLSTRKQINQQIIFLNQLLNRHDSGVKHVTNFNTSDAVINTKPKLELVEVQEKLADLINFLGKTRSANIKADKNKDANSDDISGEWK